MLAFFFFALVKKMKNENGIQCKGCRDCKQLYWPQPNLFRVTSRDSFLSNIHFLGRFTKCKSEEIGLKILSLESKTRNHPQNLIDGCKLIKTHIIATYFLCVAFKFFLLVDIEAFNNMKKFWKLILYYIILNVILTFISLSSLSN